MSLEVVAELPPGRSRERLLSRAAELLRHADSIDIPDAPLGQPAISSPIAAAMISAALGAGERVVAHLRLMDVNELGALNVAYGLSAAGVRRLVLLRGDRPAHGDPCEGSPERAAALIRSAGLGISIGHLLSLAKPLDEVMKRVASGADFFLITRPWRSPLVAEVARAARARGAKTYVYLVVRTPRNADVLASIPREEIVEPGEVGDAVRMLAGSVDGVVISAPRDFEAQLRALRDARAP